MRVQQRSVEIPLTVVDWFNKKNFNAKDSELIVKALVNRELSLDIDVTDFPWVDFNEYAKKIKGPKRPLFLFDAWTPQNRIDEMIRIQGALSNPTDLTALFNDVASIEPTSKLVRGVPNFRAVTNQSVSDSDDDLRSGTSSVLEEEDQSRRELLNDRNLKNNRMNISSLLNESTEKSSSDISQNAPISTNLPSPNYEPVFNLLPNSLKNELNIGDRELKNLEVCLEGAHSEEDNLEETSDESHLEETSDELDLDEEINAIKINVEREANLIHFGVPRIHPNLSHYKLNNDNFGKASFPRVPFTAVHTSDPFTRLSGDTRHATVEATQRLQGHQNNFYHEDSHSAFQPVLPRQRQYCPITNCWIGNIAQRSRDYGTEDVYTSQRNCFRPVGAHGNDVCYPNGTTFPLNGIHRQEPRYIYGDCEQKYKEMVDAMMLTHGAIEKEQLEFLRALELEIYSNQEFDYEVIRITNINQRFNQQVQIESQSDSPKAFNEDDGKSESGPSKSIWAWPSYEEPTSSDMAARPGTANSSCGRDAILQADDSFKGVLKEIDTVIENGQATVAEPKKKPRKGSIIAYVLENYEDFFDGDAEHDQFMKEVIYDHMTKP